MKTYDQANEVAKQITKPCEDCPFRKTATAGWLAGQTPADYCSMAHGDGVIECHTKLLDGEPVQCAGAAIYRANVAKRCDPPNLKLPKSGTVFLSPIEFIQHHARKKLTPKQIQSLMLAAFRKRLEAQSDDD